LPRGHIGSFRTALAIGIGLIGGLTLAGLYPIALAVAAAVVPVLILVYLLAVDVYEGQPVTVLVATVLWGVVTGAVFALGTAGVVSVTPGAAPSPTNALDGVTFGAAAGSAFIGAQTLVSAAGLLSGGLRPVGAAGPWLIQLLTVGVAQPILSAAVGAIVLGTVWLRMRAPRQDRAALGPMGNPVVAIVLGGAMLAAAGLGRIVLGSVAALVWLLVLAVVALVWMRLLIHIGLLEEAAEIAIGSPLACPDCGAMTPHHTFCISCGIALRALPRSHQQGTSGTDVEGTSGADVEGGPR
jgi:hypothetical protein